MEKTGLQPMSWLQKPRQKCFHLNRRFWLLLVAVLVGLPVYVLLRPFLASRIPLVGWTLPVDSELEDEPFDWMGIEPSKTLEYHACFGSFQCARLDVPLNWNASDKDAAPRAAVAVIRLPAKVPVTDSRYGGAIIMNPGGPGESGVHQVLRAGEFIQGIVGAAPSDSNGKFFDILSFDPRGVNNTTPRLKCFADAVSQHDYSSRLQDYGLLWSSPAVLGIEWGHARALGESCSRQDPATGVETVRYINTAQTVEDMLEIVERHGEWRQHEAKRRLTTLLGFNLQKTREILKRNRWRMGKEEIQYWGLSYGTLLGQTFAAMHPDRVGRLIVDGNLNAEDYYNGKWLENLHDSDKIISSYSEYCFRSGPEKCPLFTGTSAADVEDRFEAVVMGMKEDPAIVLGGNEAGPALMTYKDMHLHLLTAMYFPYDHAEQFFSLVAGVEARNNSAIAAGIFPSTSRSVQISSRCTKDGPFSDACTSDQYISGLGPFQAIYCMDSAVNGAADLTRDQFKDYVEVLRAQSKWINPSWARNRLACVGFKLKPAWTFDGPIEGYTSHPILAIGNTHDTVTPLRNAVRVTHDFPSAAMLHHDSEGHCSFSNPSLCTGRAIREYFQSGTLPKNGTTCIPEYKPFIGCVHRDEDGDCRRLSEDDEQLWENMAGFATALP